MGGGEATRQEFVPTEKRANRENKEGVWTPRMHFGKPDQQNVKTRRGTAILG